MSDLGKHGYVSPLVLHKIGHDLRDTFPLESQHDIPAKVVDHASRIPDVHGEPRIAIVFKTGVEHLKDEPLI